MTLVDLPIFEEIRGNPYYHALGIAESGLNPDAKNPHSSAKGLFQFIDQTAKALGLHDPFDPIQSFAAVQKLTEENKKVIGTGDPAALYAAHYLGAGLAKKYLSGEQISEKDKPIVDGFISKDGPLDRFKNIYAAQKDGNNASA